MSDARGAGAHGWNGAPSGAARTSARARDAWSARRPDLRLRHTDPRRHTDTPPRFPLRPLKPSPHIRPGRCHQYTPYLSMFLLLKIRYEVCRCVCIGYQLLISDAYIRHTAHKAGVSQGVSLLNVCRAARGAAPRCRISSPCGRSNLMAHRRRSPRSAQRAFQNGYSMSPDIVRCSLSPPSRACSAFAVAPAAGRASGTTLDASSVPSASGGL